MEADRKLFHLKRIRPMVRIEEMEETFENFFKDSDRFKKMKMMIDFEMPEFKSENPDMEFSKPKLKKPQRASKYIKPNSNKKSLF